MDTETYAEVIDSYNLSDEKKQGMSLTDYINKYNIKIKEINTSSSDVDKKAYGGIMRKMYAFGSDEIPEQEEDSQEELIDIKKQLGIPLDQASGIKSLENNQMSSMEANEKEFERLVDELMEDGFGLQEAIEEAKRVLEEKSVRRGAPSIKMAGGDDIFEMKEMELIERIMEVEGVSYPEAVQRAKKIRELEAKRKGAFMGGRMQYAGGTKELGMFDEVIEKRYPTPVAARRAGDLEDVARSRDIEKVKTHSKPKPFKMDADKIKELIEKRKKEKQKLATGGIAGVL
jgi:hypothetical protein